MGWLQDRFGRRSGNARAGGEAPAAPPRQDWRALGNAAIAAGRHDEAARCYGQGIADHPQDAALRLNHGFALLQLGQPDAAAARFSEALALRQVGETIGPDAHFLLGRARAAQGRPAEALAAFEAAVVERPDFVPPIEEALRLLHALGRHREAADQARRLAVLQPSREIDLVLAQELTLAGAHAEAQERLQGLMAAEPQWLDARVAWIELLLQSGRFEEVVAEADRTLAGAGSIAPVLVNRALALRQLGRSGEGVRDLQQALASGEQTREVRINLATMLLDLLRVDEAIEVVRAGLHDAPDDADLHWELGLCLLLRGDFRAGWPEHEWRLRRPAVIRKLMPLDAPPWRGESLAGRTLFLHPEQGLGDTIQFLRFVPHVARTAEAVLLHVPPVLEPLVAGALPANCRLMRAGDDLPSLDVQLPLMSLPAVLDADEPDFATDVPYLQADPQRTAAWRRRLPRDAVNVGIAWSGNPAHANDRNRSVPLSLFRRLAVDGCRFVTVQPDVRDTDRAELATWPDAQDCGRDLRDFGDTAALMAALDIVICVDTSVAHVAGALGRPVWILLPHAPDWRWMLERQDSPWYPTARLYRQPAAGDWASVFERVRGDLAALVAGLPCPSEAAR